MSQHVKLKFLHNRRNLLFRPYLYNIHILDLNESKKDINSTEIYIFNKTLQHSSFTQRYCAADDGEPAVMRVGKNC